VDSPHGGGKIPVMPNYLISANDDAVVLRNYEGMLVRYQAEDKPQTVRPAASRGVSSLLQGSKSALIPAGNDRMARRELTVLTNPQAYISEEQDACHEHNGPTEELLSLGVLANGCDS
ncbi:MAG TPA: lysine 2,3-aminomutase, partial [Gemmataceae bacterium]|nr:lysine 2,3-aminomutase [Gemmataceae bacterium]